MVVVAPIIAGTLGSTLVPQINKIPIDLKKNPYDPQRYSPWGRKEYRDHGVEESFRIWAIFTFLFFLISMVAGIIGLCCCCPYLTDTSFYDFFYQKFL